MTEPVSIHDAYRPSAGAEVVFVALGANLGDRKAALAGAGAALAAHPSCVLLGVTEPEETPPLGPTNQPDYLNQMLAITTRLSPLQLLDVLLDLERRAGRVREQRWGPRTLDCDIVAFGERRLDEARLVVPHPELPNRDFWQRELAQLRALPGVAAALAQAA